VPTEIQGVPYFTHTEIADQMGVRRETLWRWRREGKVPQGKKFRGKQVLFTEAEAAEIEEYAYRLEPIRISDPDQLRLFNGKGTMS